MPNDIDLAIDLFAEDTTALTVDELPNDSSLASVSTAGTFGCLLGSTVATAGTASSQG
ncbi:thiocillin family RiPP [Streptomyces erythrochromogenes]|uniref:Thiocillin family RiPP n=1 Tax=Streptomyces erythrochromogenes TaxID=285574 RepID=A0ABZ1QKE1_9ACTN|nr:thiocillin family RiPP [Streptomyces erythrochromogenes]MCX5588615.1 thiocillin family RiPP [Streptomyces erythrochromogenes]